MSSVLKWTLIILGVIAVAAVVGEETLGKHSGRRLPSHPIPVGQAADLGVGWRLKVLLVSPSVDRAARAAESAHRLPNGARYFLVNLAATYLGSAKRDPADLAGLGIETVGAHGGTYDGEERGECLHYVPKPAFARSGPLSRGRTAHGYLCFQIEASDAKTLLIHTGDFSSTLRIGIKGLHSRWFATPNY